MKIKEMTAVIKKKLSTDKAWAERALIALYERQTTQEQESLRTIDKNGKGFSAFDAEILTSFAKQLKFVEGKHLSQKQLKVAFKTLPKYAGQLARVALKKEAA